MKLHEIEVWARRVVGRVERNEQKEDSLVELKAKWPEPRWTARQLAGHANAAAGADILWLVGVDEGRGVVGAADTQAGDWWNQLRAEFEGGVAPDLRGLLSFDHDGLTVVAMGFSTARPPYVIRNPSRGTDKSGPFALEVPWRDASGTRSAGRADLLALLSESLSTPTIEVLFARVMATTVYADNPTVPVVVATTKERATNWYLELELYVTYCGEQEIVVPFHRVHLAVNTATARDVLLDHVGVAFRVSPGGRRVEVSSRIAVESTEIVIRGSGSVRIDANIVDARDFPEPVAADVQVAAEFAVAGQALPIVLGVALTRQPVAGLGPSVGKWVT